MPAANRGADWNRLGQVFGAGAIPGPNDRHGIP